MKKITFIALLALGGLGVLTAAQKASSVSETSLTKGTIDFKITNDLGKEFKYCVNGGHNYISSGSTKSFSYSDGQEFKYIDGSNCGKTWFKASSSMHGKSYKLSELVK